MTIRDPHPTTRRDLGDPFSTLASAKKNLRRTITVQATREFPATHRSRDAYGGNESAQSEIATSDARLRHGEVHGARWRARSTLLLIVGVGALFWGAILWLILR